MRHFQTAPQVRPLDALDAVHSKGIVHSLQGRLPVVAYSRSVAVQPVIVLSGDLVGRVFLILNRTNDQDLGDMPEGNGDSSLTLKGNGNPWP